MTILNSYNISCTRHHLVKAVRISLDIYENRVSAVVSRLLNENLDVGFPVKYF